MAKEPKDNLHVLINDRKKNPATLTDLQRVGKEVCAFLRKYYDEGYAIDVDTGRMWAEIEIFTGKLHTKFIEQTGNIRDAEISETGELNNSEGKEKKKSGMSGVSIGDIRNAPAHIKKMIIDALKD